MKKGIVLALLLTLAGHLFAQSQGDAAKVAIRVHQPERDFIQGQTRDALENKLLQIATQNGMAANGMGDRFVITAKGNVASKNLVTGSPSKVAEKISLTILVGDVVENKIFGSATLMLTGVGMNEAQAEMAAINTLKPQTSELAQLIANAKEQIVAYYEDNCERIIKDAYAKAARQEYDAALSDLANVPAVSTVAYNKCRDAIHDIYIQKIDSEGKALLTKAQMAWSTNPHAAGAKEAINYLQGINVLASCQPDAEKLMATIVAKLDQDEKREIEKHERAYRDAKEREAKMLALEQRRSEKREALRDKVIDVALDAVREGYADPLILKNVMSW